MEQLATAHLLGDLDAVLARARPGRSAPRRQALRSAIARAPARLAAPMPAGGLFLWCALPTPSSSAFAVAARPAGVVLTPGPRFGPDGAFESRIRLPYARPSGELEAAVARLAPVWRGLTGDAGTEEDDLLVV